jgi:hypothetical protein
MSKRSVEHNLRLLDCVEDFQNFLMVDGAAVEVTASNFQQVSQAPRSLKLVLDMTQRMKDRIHANSDKHMVAKNSPLGWKMVSVLEDLEGSLGRISMVDLRAQETSYMKHLAAMDTATKSVGDGAGSNNNNKWKGKAQKKKGSQNQNLILHLMLILML